MYGNVVRLTQRDTPAGVAGVGVNTGACYQCGLHH